MGMLDDDFFIRFVSLFQDLATTLLDGVDNIPNVVDVTVAPAPLVRWLGSWIGVDNIDSSIPVDLQRRIVQESSQILGWRGTRRGLVRFLELISQGAVEVEDSGGIFVAGEGGHRAPHVRMRVESTGWVREDEFVKLVIDELPANVTFELFVRDKQLWPPMSRFDAVPPVALVLPTPEGEVRVAVVGEGAGEGTAAPGDGSAVDGGDVPGDQPPIGGRPQDRPPIGTSPLDGLAGDGSVAGPGGSE
jgi:phage tail-like protein